MAFADQIQQWTGKVRARERAVFENVVQAIKTSIVDGSPVTGAPGQPVAAADDPKLKESWTATIEGNIGTVATDVSYANDVENGTRNGRAMTLRSPVGGWHSLKLTRAGFSRLVDQVTQELVGRG